MGHGVCEEILMLSWILMKSWGVKLIESVRALTDGGFIGPKFTWCNNRRLTKRIWKRLDRILINDDWAQKLQNNLVRHLARTGSDHRPLLFKFNDDQHCSIKYFKFLNFWINQPDFCQTVEKSWKEQVRGNAMWTLQVKLKRLGRVPSHWSRHNIRDVHENVQSWEARMELLENLDIMNNSDHSREDLNKGYAEYVKWLSLQDSLLKQKAKLSWFKDGEKNTKYFHSVLRFRRRKLEIQRIKNHRGRWIQGKEKIAKNTVKHFGKQFNFSLNLE
ncbi:uncharacterized protein LOC132624737 [Lycium barbarum]|uniref:uncharacterized protein LOC132624737 n=1 Tax=Lycium barbarum TaxID=112863 RepID=UPI00293E9F4E|nr:uncharacterized protein LOC132624737 [Lycium barbarum]